MIGHTVARVILVLVGISILESLEYFTPYTELVKPNVSLMYWRIRIRRVLNLLFPSQVIGSVVEVTPYLLRIFLERGTVSSNYAHYHKPCLMPRYGSKYSQATKSSSHGQITNERMLSRLPYSGVIIDFHLAIGLKFQKNSNVRKYVFRVVHVIVHRATPCQPIGYLAYCKFTFVALPGNFDLKRTNGFTLRSVPG